MQLIPKDAIEYIENIYTIPKEQNIALSTIEKQGIAKSQMLKRLIHANKIHAVTFGRKLFIPRMELIRYLAQELKLVNNDTVA